MQSSVADIQRLEQYECDSLDVLIRVIQTFERAAGFETLFPPQPLPTRMGTLLQSLRGKMDRKVVPGEAVLDNTGKWSQNRSSD